MNIATVDYLMNDPREAGRLADKVDADAWVKRYLTPHVNGSSSLLDVACGPGALAVAAAKAHPGLQVTGIDLCADRFAANIAGLPANVELKAGHAYSLPFDNESFGIVYCRFLLEYLSQRERAVREMVRVCKPGGRVILQDLDGQLVWHHPKDTALEGQLARVLHVLGKNGFDPFVGRKLFAYAKAVGLSDIKVMAESYHLYAGPIDDHNHRLWELKLDIAMPAAAEALGSKAAAEELKARFLKYLRRKDTLTYSVVFTVVGRRRNASIEDISQE